MCLGVFGDREGVARPLHNEIQHSRCLATIYYPRHSGSVRTHDENRRIRKSFCSTLALKSPTPSIPLIVMHPRGGTLPIEFDQCPHVTSMPVDLMVAKTDHPQYKYMRTKFQIWKAMQCMQVLFMDLDVLFVRDPTYVFNYCPPQYDLCAVHDQGMQDKSYFNAGVMVLKPSLQTFDRLNKASLNGPAQMFAEQDTLNKLSSWHAMPIKCNLMGACCGSKIDWHDTIIVHEKIYLLAAYDQTRVLQRT